MMGEIGGTAEEEAAAYVDRARHQAGGRVHRRPHRAEGQAHGPRRRDHLRRQRHGRRKDRRPRSGRHRSRREPRRHGRRDATGDQAPQEIANGSASLTAGGFVDLEDTRLDHQPRQFAATVRIQVNAVGEHIRVLDRAREIKHLHAGRCGDLGSDRIQVRDLFRIRRASKVRRPAALRRPPAARPSPSRPKRRPPAGRRRAEAARVPCVSSTSAEERAAFMPEPWSPRPRAQ